MFEFPCELARDADPPFVRVNEPASSIDRIGVCWGACGGSMLDGGREDNGVDIIDEFRAEEGGEDGGGGGGAGGADGAGGGAGEPCEKALRAACIAIDAD